MGQNLSTALRCCFQRRHPSWNASPLRRWNCLGLLLTWVFLFQSVTMASDERADETSGSVTEQITTDQEPASNPTTKTKSEQSRNVLQASIRRGQARIVKIDGVGGLRGLESYQSGFLISPDGHVLTVWSYVLDTEHLAVTLDDGRRYEAELVGADPHLEIAVLKLNASDLPYYDLDKAATCDVGTRVLAFTNLYRVATGDEPASVQRGVISATTNLTARKGTFKTSYRGPVYVTDAMTNNPGAAGGVVTTMQGELLGLVGKELRNLQDNTWLNYAIPIEQLRESADSIVAGKQRPQHEDWDRKARDPVDLAALGVVLVSDVVDNTPPFIDRVLPDSSAYAAGFQPDDLILFVDNVLVQSLDDLHLECSRIERGQVLAVTVRRGDELKVIELATVVD